MKYAIDFQYMNPPGTRPTDDGEVVGIKFSSDEGSALIPNVGDYVNIDNSADGGERSNFHGKVRSRLFSYIRASSDVVFCLVNIVVEKDNDDWGLLLKE